MSGKDPSQLNDLLGFVLCKGTRNKESKEHRQKKKKMKKKRFSSTDTVGKLTEAVQFVEARCDKCLPICSCLRRAFY